MYICKNDVVQVIAGDDKGTRGKVIRVLRAEGKVVVEGVNRVIKHKKATQTQAGGTAGGRETHEAPIHLSNVALVDPKDNKPTRVGYREEKVERDGRTKTVRVRYSRRTGEEI